MPEHLLPPDAALPDGRKDDGPQLVLGFDFGLRRIGVACGDTVSCTASPLVAVANGVAGPAWTRIDSLILDWRPTVVVVGLPYNVDGTESRSSMSAREFAAALSRRYALPVRLVDERYSSLEADARLKSLRDAGLRTRRVVKTDVDSAAACVILERWFMQTMRIDAITAR